MRRQGCSMPSNKIVETLQNIKSYKGAITNNVDPDETPQNVSSHQGLRHLPC